MRTRFDYVKYDERSLLAQEALKSMFTELTLRVELMPKGRAQALAITKLEEAYMWCGKAIRDEQIERTHKTELLEERREG